MNTSQGPRAQEDVSEIRDAAHRGAELTRQLLMFSRGKSIPPRKIDLANVIRPLTPMLQRLVRGDVELEIDIEPRPFPAMADPSQIERVLMNLCQNASDAMPDGGKISIRLESVPHPAGNASEPIDHSDHTEHALLTVADTGTGMTEEVRARLFEPFFTTKSGQHGTGLGLANVYAIVQQCGAHIEVLSEPGAGSVFRIQFPLTRASGAFAIDESVLLAERARVVSENNNDRRYTALVVDDDESVRRQTAKLLERAGYEVWIARDGQEALRVIGNNVDVLDIAVTDVNMPNLNGVELAGLLLASKPGLPLLFMSGEGADELENEGLLGPAASFLHKPFKPEVLLRQVKLLIRAAADAGSVDQAETSARVGLIAPPSVR